MGVELPVEDHDLLRLASQDADIACLPEAVAEIEPLAPEPHLVPVLPFDRWFERYDDQIVRMV